MKVSVRDISTMSNKAEPVRCVQAPERMDENEEQQINDAYDDHIEVVEQGVEEPKEISTSDLYDVKNLILEALVPPYNPVLPQGFEPGGFHLCKECGDKFVIESSYTFHMERRSMLIKYECDQCFAQITAFNKCSFLLHLRTHSNDPRSIINWSKISVGPLTAESSNSKTSNSWHQELVTPNDVCMPGTRPHEVRHCSECDAEMLGDGHEHFQGSTGNVSMDQNMKCKFCHMVLPTTCSLKAHERYHRQERPFVCPDCSKVFGLWASFCVHLFYCCFHLDKCVRYRCPACKIFIATSVALEVHILTLHVKNVFKCNACPIACFNIQALEEHKIKGHARPDLPTNAYQQCQLCPDRLIPKSRLLFHVIEHVRKPSVCVCGYQCNICKAFCQRKADFAAHRANCSEQPTNPSEGRMLMLKMQNTVVEPAGIAINQPSTSISSVLQRSVESQTIVKRESTGGRSLIKSAIAQVRTTGSQELSDCNKTLNILTDGTGEIKAVNISKMPPLVNIPGLQSVVNMGRLQSESMELEVPTSNVGTSMLSNTRSNLNGSNTGPNASGSHHRRRSNTEGEMNIGGLHQMVHLCEACGRECVYVGRPTDNADVPLQCVSCEKEKQKLPKAKAKKIKSETTQKNNSRNHGNKVKSSNSLKHNGNNTNNSGNNNSDITSSINKDTLPAKRTKIIGTDSGINKKMKIKSGHSTNKETYNCHICNKIIGTEWEVIQDHFIKVHKDFNLLVLSPKLNGADVSNKKKRASSKAMKSVSSKTKKHIDTSLDSEANNNSQDKPDTIVENTNNSRTRSETDVENKTAKNKAPRVKLEVAAPLEDGFQESGRTRRSKKTPVPKNKLPSQTQSTNCGQLISAKKEKTNGSYECFKCHYRDHDVQSFCSHIITHKTDSQAYQCMECGMCFVVKPSFQKHLFISHRIKDVDSYIQSHELCYQKPKKELQDELEDTSSQNGSEKIEENQCKVCKEKFQSSIQLNKHFRTHGMAFLMMQQQENRNLSNNAKTNTV